VIQTPKVAHRTVKVRDLDVFYHEVGPNNAPAVLLLHGYPTSSQMFRNLIPVLADRYRGAHRRSPALASGFRHGERLGGRNFPHDAKLLVTTPGVWEPSPGGLPALAALPGQFLIKDLALLSISLWSLGESLKACVRVAA
jgi:pimeloyl-ACP methyl ester carboxylesterase